jgi:hypothetical protein
MASQVKRFSCEDPTSTKRAPSPAYRHSIGKAKFLRRQHTCLWRPQNACGGGLSSVFVPVASTWSIGQP